MDMSAKQFLTDWFTELATSGFDSEVFLGALSDDLVWTATGHSPISGTYRGKQQYIDNVYAPLDARLQRWPRAEVVRIIGDSDWAVVQFHGEGGAGVNGTEYTLDYCWVVHVEGGAITEVIGYYDQSKVNDLFA